MGQTPEIKLYEAGSIPLKEAQDIKMDQLVYTNSGQCYVCVGINERGIRAYEEVHDSELVEGVTLDSIAGNKDLLSIFWTLSEKRLNSTKHADKY